MEIWPRDGTQGDWDQKGVESGIRGGRDEKAGWSVGPRMRLHPGQQRSLLGWARWGDGLNRHQRTSVKCIWGNNSRWLGLWGVVLQRGLLLRVGRNQMWAGRNFPSFQCDIMAASQAEQIRLLRPVESRAIPGGGCEVSPEAQRTAAGILSRWAVSDSSAASRTAALQAPLSLGFSRQEHWSGLPSPSPGDPPDPGIEPGSPVFPALQMGSLPLEPSGKLLG